MATVVQVDLQSGTTRLTCWVEPRVKVGNQVTLRNSEDPQRRWDVLRVGAERSLSSVNRGLSNNI